MELKYACSFSGCPYVGFELNLYGIEIGIVLCRGRISDGFELNLYGIEIAAGERHADGHVWFELNLYGIEISSTEC